MRIPKIIFSSLFIIFLVVIYSCDNAPPPLKTRSGAEKKFLTICKEEYNLTVKTKLLSNTLYIYLPLEKSFYAYKASPEGPQKSDRPQNKLTINYLNVEFGNGTFFIDYDISQDRIYAKDPGYSTVYSEEYTKKRQNIFSALHRTFSDLDEIPGNVEHLDRVEDYKYQKFIQTHIKTDTPPDFVVFLTADVESGLEIISIFTFQDFKRVMGGSMPNEEFVKRNYSELIGNAAIQKDYEGRHIEFKNLTWPEFLAKQITQRINFKYKHSDFSPTPDHVEELLTIVKTTFHAYGFSNFRNIQLRNLLENSSRRIGKAQVLGTNK